jgi:hypothetical protein
MYIQMVGKTLLALSALQNHLWNITLYLTARGLSTSAMPADGGPLLDAYGPRVLVVDTPRHRLRVDQHVRSIRRDNLLERGNRPRHPPAIGMHER